MILAWASPFNTNISSLELSQNDKDADDYNLLVGQTSGIWN